MFNAISDSVIIVEESVSNQNINYSKNLSANKDNSPSTLQTERLTEKTSPENLFSENQLSLNGNIFQPKDWLDKTSPKCVLPEKKGSCGIVPSSNNVNGGLPWAGNA